MMATIQHHSSALSASLDVAGPTAARIHARPLHLSPEVAAILSLSNGAGSLRLDGSPLRSSSKFNMSSNSKTTTTTTTAKPTGMVSPSRDSFETDITLLGEADSKTKSDSSSTARVPVLSSSTTATKDANKASKGDSQSKRPYAAPMRVSDDVQALLHGRIAGGGLSLGGEPLRASGKGGNLSKHSSKESTTTNDDDRSTGRSSTDKGKGKMHTFFANIGIDTSKR